MELITRYEQLVEERKKTLGDTHLDTLSAMEQLIEMWGETGNQAEAEPLQLHVLTHRRSQLAETDPSLFKAWSDRARILCIVGRAEEARELVTSSVEKSIAVFGPEHAVTLRAPMQRLAWYYQKRSMWPESANVLTRLINTYKLVLRDVKESRQDMLQAMLELAIVNERQRRWAEAAVLEQQVAEMSSDEPELEHFFLRAHALACINWREQREFDKSVTSGRLAVDGYTRLFGPDEEKTIEALQQLADTLNSMDNCTEAIELQQRVVEAWKKIHGDIHPITRNALELLSAMMLRQRRVVEGEALLERNLQIALSLSGAAEGEEKDSELVSHCLATLAQAKILAGKHHEAIELHSRALAMWRRMQPDGGYNEDTLYSLRNLIDENIEIGEYSGAHQLAREFAENIQSQYFNLYPDDLNEGSRLADIYMKQQRYSEAEDLLQKLISAHHREKANTSNLDSAQEHEDDILDLEGKLVTVYGNMQRWAEAAELGERVLAARDVNCSRYNEDGEYTGMKFLISALVTLNKVYEALAAAPMAIEKEELEKVERRLFEVGLRVSFLCFVVVFYCVFFFFFFFFFFREELT
ncbi:hypothetical protein BDZ91DRAFT_700663 [Kalaharituber pfeilii]|nr:hypothetical protein BDZ91DRAFT_700663 [Kalaharituber pfeilii]